jgi:hypothetical protein
MATNPQTRPITATATMATINLIVYGMVHFYLLVTILAGWVSWSRLLATASPTIVAR